MQVWGLDVWFCVGDRVMSTVDKIPDLGLKLREGLLVKCERV